MLVPFALRSPLATSTTGRHARDYYETSAPPQHPSAGHMPSIRTGLAARTGWAGRRMVPTFTERSIGQVGTQLYPDSIAASTPQTFDAASPPPVKDGFGVNHHHTIPP